MDTTEVFVEIGDTLSKMGVGIPSDPAVTVNEIIDLGSDLDLDAIEELLNRLTAYNIFLKSQKGSFEGQLAIKEGELKRRLHLETQRLPKQSQEGSFYTKEEKCSLVLSGALKDLNEEVLRLKAIVARIRDLPFAIDRKIDLLKMKYRRLSANEYRQEG